MEFQSGRLADALISGIHVHADNFWTDLSELMRETIEAIVALHNVDDLLQRVLAPRGTLAHELKYFFAKHEHLISTQNRQLASLVGPKKNVLGGVLGDQLQKVPRIHESRIVSQKL